MTKLPDILCFDILNLLIFQVFLADSIKPIAYFLIEKIQDMREYSGIMALILISKDQSFVYTMINTNNKEIVTYIHK
ncbi:MULTISPECIES: hypothetical protein [Chlamydia]|uniref:Uncharacterized protein n=1 Tax=Chlamydophila parapsittaci TaxID=344886 RepID=A0ABX5VW62_9CHLA|nr:MULTISPECIES: hypothetical protein [Chlamydia]EPP31593.1 hypothetical protein CPC197_0723 [Chlamydia psittaci C1/97]AFS20708.1 hypothetical protein B598_0625 [Chlamydia psittaci GR9]AFS23600.1 hypothetical protein B601_0627 [Chlamydia psittaci WS/RT/E30]EPP28450.1 hypothetical protein CP082626L3_0834 [Chlamydia psittaci 08-2626_L3]QDE36817.1 hypothetical protein FI836_00490 [Chlamydophila parapsittaci]